MDVMEKIINEVDLANTLSVSLLSIIIYWYWKLRGCSLVDLYPPQADATPAKIKERLIFRDDDELDIGMQKVQPLPILGTPVPVNLFCKAIYMH